MIVKTAEFICSNTQISKLPPPVKPEYAFIGRSNVGKSSLINMLTAKKGLAKICFNAYRDDVAGHDCNLVVYLNIYREICTGSYCRGG